MLRHIVACIFCFALCLHSTVQQSGTSTGTSGQSSATGTGTSGQSSGTVQGTPAALHQACTYNQSNPQGNCALNAECRAAPRSTCECAQGFQEENNKCKIKIGEAHCTTDKDCIGGAFCQHPSTTSTATPTVTPTPPADGICQCNSTNYPTNEGLCKPRIPLNLPCEPLANGHSPCEDPTVTICHSRRCLCNDYYYKNENSKCTPRLLVNSRCITNGTCVSDASCLNMTCQCDINFFRNDSRHCQKRIYPGQRCVETAYEVNPCTEGATCFEGVCRCNLFLYKESATGCTAIKHIGNNCTDPNECPLNAYCNKTTQTGPKICMCLDDYIYNEAARACQQRKPAGSSCLSSEECVANARCVDKVCICDLHFYNDNHRCNPRVNLNFPCDPLIPDQCLLNGECVYGSCKCNNRSYDNEAANCPLTLPFGEPCNWANNNPRQCVSNTSCIFGQENNMPECGCDINHFFDGNYCIKRAMAGDSCPYHNDRSLGHTVNEFSKQCVVNAECNAAFDLCTCITDHYNRNGHCPKRIATGQPCDPWVDYDQQCVDNNLCLYGQCLPSDGRIVGPIG